MPIHDPTVSLPIFPLGTVLFPEGQLPLRIFEARYTDMVRRCLKTETPFGVCLIGEGAEAGPARSFASVGCSARIVDTDMEQLGLLLIETRGTDRFEVLEHAVQKDGLVMAQVRWIAADDPLPLPDQYQPLADLLERLARETDRLPGELRLNDGVWVSNRVAEMLPVASPLKQKLMALEDAGARLMLVQQILEKVIRDGS
jgi:uncharacterized protein